MGRYELEGYPKGALGDYYIVTDAIDEYLDECIHEDDIAEAAIYAGAIELAGAIVLKVLEINKVSSRCVLCGLSLGMGDSADWHADDCPCRGLNSLIAASYTQTTI